VETCELRAERKPTDRLLLEARMGLTIAGYQLDETIPYPGSLPGIGTSSCSVNASRDRRVKVGSSAMRNLLSQVGQDYGFDEREIPPAFVVRDR
jgi:hypothetical protein